MIKQISGISIKGRCFHTPKSFSFFPNEKTRVALVYGANGSGKSTISTAFKTLANHEYSELQVSAINAENESIALNTPQISVFDEDYIDSNMRINEEGLGCIILLGEQVDLQGEIDSAKETLRIETEKTNALKGVCDSYIIKTNPLSPEFHWEQIGTILKSTSGWARTDSQLRDMRQNSKVTDAVIQEICKMVVTKPLEQLQAEFTEKKSLLDSSATPNPAYSAPIRTINMEAHLEEDIIALLARRLDEPVLSEREQLILTMVQGGYQGQIENSRAFFSKSNQSVCPYCFQTVDDEYKHGLIENINRVLNKDVDQHKEQLLSFRLDELIDRYSQYAVLDANINTEISNAITEYNKILRVYKEAIQSKISSIYTPIAMEKVGLIEISTKLNSLLMKLENARRTYMQTVTQRTDLKDDLLQLNKQIAYWFCKDAYVTYLKQVEEKKEHEAAYQQQNRISQQLERNLAELLRRKENLALAIECINDALAFVFFSKDRLSIELRNGKYYLKSKGHDVKPKNVSQGERNIIALCYFFIQIGANRELSKIYNQEQLLVIDDPVSSFDFENKVGIISLLRREIKKVIFGNDNSKIILLSHDLASVFDMQKAMAEIKKAAKNDTTAKDTEISWLELDRGLLKTFNKNRNEYAILIDDILKYADGDATYEISIGNKMRRVLEAFSTFCYRKSIEDVSCDREILSQLGDDADYFENRMYRLVLHGGSHFEYQIYSFHDAGNFFEFISADEKKNTARDVLCFMYLLNRQHIKAYIPAAEIKIQRWCVDIRRAHATSQMDRIVAMQNDRIYKTVKLYDMPISAGSGIDLLDNDLCGEDYETTNAACDFAIKISGDSMEPDFLDDSIILVHKQDTLENGEIGAFYYDGVTYCKKLRNDGGKIQLVSINSQYGPIVIEDLDAFRCYGKVIGVTGFHHTRLSREGI